MSLLEGILEPLEDDSIHPQVEAIDTWLSELGDCGVDLYEYGRREEELYWDGSTCRTFQIYGKWGKCYYSYRTWELVSFTYGSSPSDWHLQLELEPEGCDEQSEQVKEIPGSWLED